MVQTKLYHLNYYLGTLIAGKHCNIKPLHKYRDKKLFSNLITLIADSGYSADKLSWMI